MSAETTTSLELGPSFRITWGSFETFRKVLTRACEAGNLSAIDQLLSDWEDSPGSYYRRDDDYDDLDLVLRKTIKWGKLDAAAYLIENGFTITSKVANVAVRAQSIDMLGWLLAHGWDMNGFSEFPRPSLKYANRSSVMFL